MAPVKIGINGFGRIGRLVFRCALAKPELVEVVAFNDPFLDPKYAAYQLKYDSVHGRFKGTVTYDKDHLIVNGKKIRAFKAKSPAEMSDRRTTNADAAAHSRMQRAVHCADCLLCGCCLVWLPLRAARGAMWAWSSCARARACSSTRRARAGT
jgi:hypothetical protein